MHTLPLNEATVVNGVELTFLEANQWVYILDRTTCTKTMTNDDRNPNHWSYQAIFQIGLNLTKQAWCLAGIHVFTIICWWQERKTVYLKKKCITNTCTGFLKINFDSVLGLLRHLLLIKPRKKEKFKAVKLCLTLSNDII